MQISFHAPALFTRIQVGCAVKNQQEFANFPTKSDKLLCR